MAARAAALAAGATPLAAPFHHFGAGLGVTGVLLLQESHISIHTWPEHQFTAIDLFMCGACQPANALALLQDAMCPGRVIQHLIPRGQAAAFAVAQANPQGARCVCLPNNTR